MTEKTFSIPLVFVKPQMLLFSVEKTAKNQHNLTEKLGNLVLK